MFFAGLGFLSFLLSLPFEIWHTFRLEARHGFNKQTRSGFIQDRVKGILLAVVLGGPLLALVLWIMSQMGPLWWVWAWTALSLFSLFTAWAFPVLISPLFNKFSPLPDGELKAGILELARKIGFRAAGISIMDGSRRTSHGNAYFTGVFGAKKIVLFDTLVSAMTPREVIAVLAHELGHFKLHHIRWSLVRGLLMTGLVFWLLSLALPMTQFYEAFGLAGVSHHGALVVFSLWFGLIEFLMQPLSAAFSRRNEFAADRFAWQHLGQAQDLINALRKLREQSRSMPISHPLFSAVYHSHPPLLERLQVLMRL
jgi:STE24 endopeptidase